MDKSLYKNLIVIITKYRWTYAKGFLMVLISNCLLVANPLIFRIAVIAVDPLSKREGGYIENFFYSLLGEKVNSLSIWAAILIGIALVSAVFKYGMRMTFITASRDAELDIRSKVFEKIQMQSMLFFDRYGIGELLSRITNDIAAYRDVLGPGIMYPLFFLTIIVPSLAALFTISPHLALISIVPLLAIPIFNYMMRKKIYQVAFAVQKTLGRMSGMVQEHFSAIRIVKSYGIETKTRHQFKELCDQMLKKELKLSYLQGSLFPFFTFLTKTITAILVLSSGWLILKQGEQISTADFVSFMWIQSYIFYPVVMLSWLIPVYERGRAAYNRLLEIYEEPIEVQDKPHSTLQIKPGMDIQIENLSFAYPMGNSEVLSSINLMIKGGVYVGITGPVGSGKTTLFRLLSREYEIPRGMISIDGQDIHDYSLKSIHSQIVSVEQGPFLFSKTIGDNVRFGRKMATQEEVEMVAEYADLHETVLGFPEQYETVIGERGVTLSGGQKQRLAMARAFLVDRSILLLDDVFSAVDFATERKIYQAIETHFVGKTVLLITHRVSVLEKMDWIVYLDKGTVVEEGTHEELMRKGGHYAALIQLQMIKEDPS